MSSIVQKIVELFQNSVSKELLVFIISLCPVLELRGGLLAASLLKIPYIKAAVLSIIGNILPIPFILLFMNKILSMMENIKFTKKFAEFLKNKAIKNKPQIDKYGFWGLTIFVGIPLPMTGAWTGALIASVFHMDLKKASIAIFLGILLAFIIMSIISYGIVYHIT